MEASATATAARHALPPLIASPRCFLYLPPHPSAPRYGGRGDGGGLLLRPPLRVRQDPGDRMPRAPTCCCYMSVGGVDSGPLVSAAAVLAALQVLLLWWRCDSLEVLREDDRTVVNKAQGATKAVQNNNCEPQTTHDNGFSEPYVSGRVTVDEIDSRPWTSLDTSVYISRPKEASASTSTAESSYSEKVTGVPGMPQSVLGQDKSKYLSTTLGRVTGLPHQFLSLSRRKEVIKSCQGHIDKPVDSEGSNLFERHQSNQEEHLDLTCLSSFQRVAKNHSNFVPHARSNSLLEPRKSIKFGNSYANFSYLPAGNLCPVACLKEGPLSEQKKAMKGHENATVIGLNISKVLKENPDNLTPAKKGEMKGMKDTLDYLRIYNSFLIDGRLEDCVDLLESMEQKGFLDIERIHHASFFSMCKKRKAVSQALRFCRLIGSPKMSTFNMLLSVCAHSQDFDGALQVMVLLKEAGLTPDCKLYTTLISTCAKCGKVDAMFEVFHEMVSAGIEPNVNTYSALIDGCARAGQVAKAFGAYGIMSSKKVKPDRVVFNALISACGESGAVARAFDVLSEMIAESSESKGTGPIFPDHVTVGALMKTCIQAGQAHRAREVYKMLHDYDIKGTPEVYTIALRSCSLTGDLGFALKIYEDMNKTGVKPDEMFLSALVDVAGHARRADAAFEIMKDARAKDLQVGTMAYSSLMGACCNAKDWKKALQLYKEIKSIKLVPTVSTMNALITSLCDGDQVSKAIDVLKEMNRFGLRPNEITYSVLFVACERNSEAQRGLDLFERSKLDGIGLNPTIIGCITGLCLQMFENDLSLGNIIVKFNLGKPQIDNKWTSAAIRVYREAILVGLLPSSDVLSQVLGCLRLPHDSSLKNTFIENTGISCDIPQHTNVNSLLEGFGEYDIRAFSILEEAASLGAVESITMKDSRIVIDARKSRIYTAEVSLLTTLRSLKHRLAAGARLPNVTILLQTEKKLVDLDERERTLKLAGRIGQAVGSLLRRLGISYQGDESHGRMRINGLTLRRWFNPKLQRTSSAAAPAELLPLPLRLAKGIADQQRKIRNLSLE